MHNNVFDSEITVCSRFTQDHPSLMNSSSLCIPSMPQSSRSLLLPLISRTSSSAFEFARCVRHMWPAQEALSPCFVRCSVLQQCVYRKSEYKGADRASVSVCNGFLSVHPKHKGQIQQMAGIKNAIHRSTLGALDKDTGHLSAISRPRRKAPRYPCT